MLSTSDRKLARVAVVSSDHRFFQEHSTQGRQLCEHLDSLSPEFSRDIDWVAVNIPSTLLPDLPITQLLGSRPHSIQAWKSYRKIWHGHTQPLKTSFDSYAWLRNHSHDLVVFCGSPDLGYVTVQAQRTGVAFQNCVLHYIPSSPDPDVKTTVSDFPGDSLCLDYFTRYLQEPSSRFRPSFLGEATALETTTESEPSPLISLLVPHYNLGDYLAACLDSLAEQTYPHIEILVLDDGSTDVSSLKLFRSLAEKYRHDERFRFFEEPNQDIGKARNYLAEQARGSYLIFSDADNVFRPDMAASLLSALQKSGARIMTCYRYIFFEDAQLELGSFDALAIHVGGCVELGFLKNTLGDMNFCIRKKDFQHLGQFREARQQKCYDWEFLARAGLKGYYMDCCPEPLFYYRVRYDSISRSRDKGREAVSETYLQDVPPWAKQHLLQCIELHQHRRDAAKHSRTTELQKAFDKSLLYRVAYRIFLLGSSMRETLMRVFRSG